jgi:hypothetical protein
MLPGGKPQCIVTITIIPSIKSPLNYTATGIPSGYLLLYILHTYATLSLLKFLGLRFDSDSCYYYGPSYHTMRAVIKLKLPRIAIQVAKNCQELPRFMHGILCNPAQQLQLHLSNHKPNLGINWYRCPQTPGCPAQLLAPLVIHVMVIPSLFKSYLSSLLIYNNACIEAQENKFRKSQQSGQVHNRFDSSPPMQWNSRRTRVLSLRIYFYGNNRFLEPEYLHC